MKRCELIIKEEANLEINEAYDWYENKSEGLGERFLESLDNCFNTISRQPKIFQKIYKKQRQAILRTFPYIVMYQKYDNQIITFAVFNTYQEAKKKLRGK